MARLDRLDGGQGAADLLPLGGEDADGRERDDDAEEDRAQAEDEQHRHVTSDLHLDDLAHPERPDDEQDDPMPIISQPERVGDQRIEVRRPRQ